MTVSLSSAWQSSSSTSPCPVCGRTKDSDCSWTYENDSGVCMCHTAANPSSKVPQPPEEIDGWKSTNKEGQSGYTNAIAYVKKNGGWIKPARPNGMTYYYYPNDQGENLCRVARWDNPDGKRIWQEYWLPSMKNFAKDGGWVSVSKNKVKNKKATHADRDLYVKLSAQLQSQVHLYKIDHRLNVEAKANDGSIFIVEGEGLADLLLSLGVPATCPIGGAGKWDKYGGMNGNYVHDLTKNNGEIVPVVLCPDRDSPGIKHCETVEASIGKENCKWGYASPESPEWYALPSSGGFDLKDWIEAKQREGLNDSDIRNLIVDMAEDKRNLKPKERVADKSTKNEVTSFAKKSFYQEIFAALYGSENYICVSDEMYRWEGSYYKKVPDAEESRRVWAYCNEYIGYTKDGEAYHPYAQPSKVETALKWIKTGLAIAPERVNPPGINCTNGILRIHWKGSKPSWQLLPHDPSQVYIYEPKVKYDPEADVTDCDRLLSVLDGPHRDIFLKTIAASLDLEQVRRYKGRSVKALLLKGDGANGKDTLREAVSLLYGRQGITGCSTSDFLSYDTGRKFPLSKLEFSRVNWASETPGFSMLDRLQSLKIAVTGDNLDYEPKQKDERSGPVKAIFLFNMNESPNLKAALEAIKSRYAVISFNKTFAVNADASRGEIEADARFKYDPCFMQNMVLPAFLNRVLESLQSLMTDGIDYSSTMAALDEMQSDSSHLYRFSKATGLIYCPGDRIAVSELWEKLSDWYKEEEIMSYDPHTGKTSWLEADSKTDKYVKGSNYLVKRLKEVFPKIKRVTDGTSRKVYVVGLSWQSRQSHQKVEEKSAIENSKDTRDVFEGYTETYSKGINEIPFGPSKCTVGNDFSDRNSSHSSTNPDFDQKKNKSDLIENEKTIHETSDLGTNHNSRKVEKTGDVVTVTASDTTQTLDMQQPQRTINNPSIRLGYVSDTSQVSFDPTDFPMGDVSRGETMIGDYLLDPDEDDDDEDVFF